jgi:ribosomal protein S27AE
MSDVQVYALKCPNCGAKLNVAKSLDVFACSYCGASIKLAQSGGVVALELLAGQLAGVRRGTDKTAAELALRRLKEKGAELDRESAALRQRENAMRTEIITAREKVRMRQFPLLTLGSVALVTCILSALVVSGRLPFPMALFVVCALVVIVTVPVGFVIYRGASKLMVVVDAREKAATESHAILANKMAAEIELNRKKIAEAQIIADS